MYVAMILTKTALVVSYYLVVSASVLTLLLQRVGGKKRVHIHNQ